MMKKMIITLIGCLFAVVAYATNISQLNSPVGYWRTIDDKTKAPKAIVHITETPDNQLQGKIVRLFEKPESLCTLCQGNKHNQPILGMVFLEKLILINFNEWGNGKILDPKNGQVYKCKLFLKDNGQRLEVRGYLGIPLLGRTQIWERVDNISASQDTTALSKK